MAQLSLAHAARDLGLAATLARCAAGPAPLPIKLTLALTWSCHHRCQACGIWQRPRGEQMTAAQLDALFASVPDLRWLDLTGGEVSARADIAAIGASIRRRLPRLAMLHFPTGGFSTERTLAAARALRWPRGPRLVLTVSFDGPPQVHDRLRGVQGAFAAAARTWAALRAEGFEACPGMTLQPGNLDAIEATVSALKAEDPGFSRRDLHVNVAHTSGHYFGNEAAGLHAHRKRAIEVAQAFAATKGRPTDPVQVIEAAYLALLPAYARTGRSPIPCRSGELSAYIAPDGEVFACTIDPASIGTLSAFGYDLARLWRTERRAAVTAAIAADRCAGCWTPCEAYQTLLASPVATLRALKESAR